MSQGLNFISGVVMLVVAGTLVFVVTREDEASAAAGNEAYAPEKSPRDWGTEIKRPRFEGRTARAEAVPGRPEVMRGAADGGARALKPGQLRSDLRVLVGGANLQHGDLVESAERVEAFAMRRLGMLTEQLELTSEQQARIFPILVRGSQSYDPRMRIVSDSQARPLADNSSSAPVDKSQEQALLQQELSSAQSDELVNQSIRDLLIWEEIIDGLANQLDQAKPGQVDETPQNGTTGGPELEGPTEDVTEPAAPLESHGGRNLFGP